MIPALELKLITILFFASVVSAQYGTQLQPPDYSYSGQNGPLTWAQKYDSCNGQKQSPIDITTSSATKMDFPPLNWTDYIDPARSCTLMNNWQGVQLMFPPGSEARLRGGPLASDYVLSYVIFKWGNELGSEHSIDKYFYGLEAQLVHFKKSAVSIDAALNQPDGLAIVSIMFGINLKSNLSDLDPVVSNLKSVTTGGSTQDLPSGRYMNWLRKYINSDCGCTKETYYTYMGSVTNPPCSENVIWIIMANPLPIGQNQLKEFQKVKGIADAMVAENKRPLQQVNGRKLQYKQGSGIPMSQPLMLVPILFLIKAF
ncbi:carbonic anhydrase 2-like [Neocloeon triangulifer]|uniref:carbonic anhydrase 2-like n=1 Tax=Neocloeon triangulifer TaxID=2078957 RepID=UPI00286F0869|nr:carbonic anhydrase 2-like [Neocloeon triangulifer]